MLWWGGNDVVFHASRPYKCRSPILEARPSPRGNKPQGCVGKNDQTWAHGHVTWGGGETPNTKPAAAIGVCGREVGWTAGSCPAAGPARTLAPIQRLFWGCAGCCFPRFHKGTRNTPGARSYLLHIPWAQPKPLRATFAQGPQRQVSSPRSPGPGETRQEAKA